MAAISCPTAIECFPCADDSQNPFQNLSAEQNDTERFLSFCFFPCDRTPRSFPPNTDGRFTCATVCESSISQQEADDCAARKAAECTLPSPECVSTVNNPCERRLPPVILYYNTEGCTAVPPGTVVALSQADADAIAQSKCDTRGEPPSPPSPPEPDENCPQEATSPATPTTLSLPVDEMMNPIEVLWQQVTVQSPQALKLNPWPPGSVDTGRQILSFDFPPGGYELQYIQGVWRYTNFVSDTFDFLTGVSTLSDEEQNTDIPNDPLADINTVVSGEFAGLEADDYFEATDPNADEAEIHAQNYWGSPNTPSTSPSRWVKLASHSNTDQDMFMSWEIFDGVGILADHGIYGPLIEAPGHPMQFRLYQVDGLIPQPRKIAISDYASVSEKFADQSAADAWDGTFPNRTMYSEMDAKWNASGIGAFGGAVISWTMTHPTSENGRGWQMDIYSAGMILLWRGFRGIGKTPLGRFYRDSTTTPTGPLCLTCFDISERVWYPTATPPV